MSAPAAAAKPRPNAAQRLGRKKRNVLIALAAITLLTWSRQVFGGEEKQDDAAGVGATAAGASAAAGAKAKAGAPRSKTILNFEQAQERMKAWPEALNRRVYQGHIEDLLPIHWLLGPATTAPVVLRPTEPGAPPTSEDPAAAAPAELPPQPEPEIPTQGVLPVRLRSTAIFGSKRYAVIEGVRYAEGEIVQVSQGAAAGTYLLERVRSREVVLRQGDLAWTVTIQEQVTRFDGWEDDEAE